MFSDRIDLRVNLKDGFFFISNVLNNMFHKGHNFFILIDEGLVFVGTVGKLKALGYGLLYFNNLNFRQ